ncbi:MAG: T9SS type A sorting domain-containing protein [Bacteroidales bacterium]|nr:T9SS type A sorting domain-containing protein [Bacteroidales bacterium]MBN2817549.1 T9SS type A sorting domain-containing protein [Bacteroidales bacterium]
MVQLNGSSGEEYELHLYDISGSLVYSQSVIETTTISLSELNIPGGIYMIKLNTEVSTISKKIVYMPQ